jgi:hypothetical protein
MARGDVVEFIDVEVLSDTGLALICVVQGKRVMVPPRDIQWGSTVWRPGDRGTLIIPRLLAERLSTI